MTTETLPTFKQITLEGEDAATFLQSQITADVQKLGLSYRPTAIADLKGRIAFGIWIKKQDEKQFDIVIHNSCLDSLQAHIKKFGTFSKFTTSEPIDIYPCVMGIGKDAGHQAEVSFSHQDKSDTKQWMTQSIATGNFWITAATQGIFQPQEMRLHQRGGVDYDKGCYLGQEVIARIYFKAAPKAFLHRVKGRGDVPHAGDSIDKIKVVNSVPLADGTGFEALVVARPEQLAESEFEILNLPVALQGSVAREA